MLSRISSHSRRWIAALGLLALGSARVQADAISYQSSSVEQQVASLDLGGVTATGSNTLVVDAIHGLNVMGGMASNSYGSGSTDASESLTFKFNSGPATGIVVSLAGTGTIGDVPANTSGETLVTAYGATGQSLGTMDLVPFLNGVENFKFDISGAFNGEPISSFVLQPKGDDQASTFIQVGGITFASSVPEPSTLALFGLVVAAPALRRLARRGR